MSPELAPVLEAVLIVADEPLDAAALAKALGCRPAQVEQTLQALARSYDEHQHGFELRNVGGGWRYYSRPEHAPAVEQFVRDEPPVRLSQAALETLAVVAYRQPVSRSRVSAVRGVNVDAVMRTLVSRGLVEEAGVERETGAVLYRTTGYFLERMGMRSLDELPDLAPFLPELADVDEELDSSVQ